MFRRISMAALALLIAVPLAAQEGWEVRLDRSANASDPDDSPDIEFAMMGEGIQINTGPATIAWHPDNTATGEYALSGTFTLKAPSDHNNYYGLVFGGADLDNSSQNYLYFLIAQNGTFLVKHRANDDAVHNVVERTAHDAINTPGEDGTSVNDLEVRITMEEIEFVVNGTVVHTQPHEGMASRTDGIYGVRVNHRIPGVLVENLSAGGAM